MNEGNESMDGDKRASSETNVVVVYVYEDRCEWVSASRVKSDVNKRRTKEDAEILGVAGWSSMCTRPYLVQKPTPSCDMVRRYVSESGGRYVGQQHAPLTEPMEQFAKFSFSWYNPATNYSVLPKYSMFLQLRWLRTKQ